MDLRTIRKVVIAAIASDDTLYEMLVLKGGNALDLVHKLGERASLDMDFSIREDFENVDNVKERLERSLSDRFDSAGYKVFDFTFGARPLPERVPPDSPKWWGGYRACFKIIPNDVHRRHGSDIHALRRRSTRVNDDDTRVFKIDISKFEYCEGKIEAEVDAYRIYVYSLDMIAAEKLRALCQQMPEYRLRGHPTARARDFYDLHSLVTLGNVRIGGLNDLLGPVFAAKDVPLDLLPKIREVREFHEPDWPSVLNSIPADKNRDFGFYFDFVVRQVATL